ncbi:LANO_0E07008g1_1 [Lachancea nothofagi CBS 11611]|uniref:LANO_0E07008g1_1 n=1 Tax=Lachancea nothofagi CBS 11611 TaxID=1266666 RepID=A0A1G4JUM1_9SACH|nr:LANO_0E07008g1_1 [Lachancea nothofagi CBS 11611]
MAKSLRAKSMLKAKSVKRKNVFQVKADARANRISEKMKEELIKQQVEEIKRKNSDLKTDEAARQALEVERMEQDDKKVSTSGWRDARHHNYKRNKKLNNNRKKGSFTKF